jgi:hypothetical protein
MDMELNAILEAKLNAKSWEKSKSSIFTVSQLGQSAICIPASRSNWYGWSRIGQAFSNIPAIASATGDAAAYNVPDASAVAVGSHVAGVIAAFGVPGVPAIVMVYSMLLLASLQLPLFLLLLISLEYLLQLESLLLPLSLLLLRYFLLIVF